MNSLFWKLTQFLPLFFASAVVTPGADVVADTGGDAGGGDADTGVVVDEPSDDGVVEELTEETTDEPIEDELAEETEGKTDLTKRLPEESIKKGLKKLRETDPKLADELRKSYFDNRTYRQTFKTPQEAVQARDLIDAAGGPEGIEQMRGEVGDYAKELTLMAQGDPQAVEDLARDFPKGLVKMAPLALEKMRQIDPVAYARTASGVTTSVLRDSGVTGSINRLHELISDGKQKQALELVADLADWTRKTEQLANLKPKDEPDPREQELNRKEQEIQTEKDRIFTQEVASAATNSMNGIISKAIAPYLRTRKLSEPQKKGLASGIFTRISESLKTNSAYQQRLASLRKAGNARDIVRFVSQHTEQLAGRAVRDEWASRGFGSGQRRTTAAATNQPSIGTKPPADQIDWSKDKGRQRYMGDGVTGEATLKSGKIVKWKW